MPVVSVPPPYRGPTRGEAEVRVEGDTVRACLGAVDARYPGFAALIFDDAGKLHGFVRVFLNEEPVEDGALDSPVGREDAVDVVAAIAGG